jgi:lipid II isoglutaminyl synthase (glutamine-hydrolysing)
MKKSLALTIGYLYGRLMNTYGDTGNVICLKKRAEERGIKVDVLAIDLNYDPKKDGVADLYFFGGGQDQAQEEVSQDLIKRHSGKFIKEEVEKDKPLLAICGGYQLLGEYYEPQNGPKLAGLGIFKAYTQGSAQRMIGNIVIRIQNLELRIKSEEKDNSSLLVGFENHSGKTFLKEGAQPLGTIIKGFGNNGEDKTEGCIYKNAIGCYMHGSLLPKNPKLADWLIKKALEVKYGEEIKLEPLEDELEQKAHQAAIQRFSK